VDRESFNVQPIDDHIAGVPQCGDTVVCLGRCLSGQQRGERLSHEHDGLGVMAEHGGESGVVVDDDAV